MKTIRLCVLLAVAACDDGSLPPDDESAAAGKADDPSIQCAEKTPSPLDGRNIEDMERTPQAPRVLAKESDVVALETEEANALLLEQLEATAVHFGRLDPRELIATSDSGVSAGQMTYGDVTFDIVIFFEDEQSHGLVFHAGTLDPVGEVGINYDIVGCKRL